MKHDDTKHAQPLRELQWLAHYFKENCREDLAQEIVQHLNALQHRAQDSEVVELKRDNEDAA